MSILSGCGSEMIRFVRCVVLLVSAPERRREPLWGAGTATPASPASTSFLARCFQGTHLPLQKWFMAIALIVNAKKSLSSCQLARDLNLTQRSAWYMQQRIRAEMATRQGKVLLRGIVEADETYVGGKPRKRNNRKGGGNAPRGRRLSPVHIVRFLKLDMA